MPQLKQQFHALGGICTLRFSVDSEAAMASGQTVMAAAIEELETFEQKYSRYRPDSVVSKINAAAGTGTAIELDAQSCALLNYAFTCYEQSDGLFDITSGILRKAWNFKENILPNSNQLEPLLGQIGLPQVKWQEPFLQLPRTGMEIDFGGFGKEYAADMLAQFCAARGIGHGLVDLGGDLAVISDPGSKSGAAPITGNIAASSDFEASDSWPIGISDPRQPDKAVARVALKHGGLASSGNYERFIDADGQRYGHILDPRTGWPVADGWAGITVIADSCLVAGTLSTIACLKGKVGGEAWLRDLGVSYLCIDADGSLCGSLAD